MNDVLRPLALALVLASAASLGSGCDAATSEAPGAGARISEGDSWPALKVRDCAGAEVDMRALVADHDATFVTFGAQWCTACQKEAPDINAKLVDGFARESVGVVQLLIEGQPGEAPAESLCAAWQDELEARFTVLVDVDQTHLADFFGGAVATLPLHFVVTRDGTIRYRKLGELPGDIDAIVRGWLP
jgi:cytochrome c biogenesis protein CcmG/thiol:disulfide interchange protein DsbE